jgi:hypothetical protein
VGAANNENVSAGQFAMPWQYVFLINSLAANMLRKLFVFSLFWISVSIPSQASSVLPLGLDQIVTEAHIGFQGICTDNHSERDVQTGLIVTYTSFDVTDVLKGKVGTTHTIKQLGGRTETGGYSVHGVPSFAVGQEYTVFLYGVSSAGFSSPVGLSQGQFAVRHGPSGAEISNGRDFKEMLEGHAGSAIPEAVANKLRNTVGELRRRVQTDSAST